MSQFRDVMGLFVTSLISYNNDYIWIDLIEFKLDRFNQNPRPMKRDSAIKCKLSCVTDV